MAITLLLYLSHVRSLLEYSTPLWSPYQVNEIMRIERVQRHVTKCILNEYSSDVSYRDRCLTLGIAYCHCVTAEKFPICVFYLNVYMVKLILTLIHTYNLYCQIAADGLLTKEHYFI